MTIEYKYYISELPEGFEIVEHGSLSFCVDTLYENEFSGQTIKLSQYTKNIYKPHYNTEYNEFEEFDINGHYALYLKAGNYVNIRDLLVWDDGDYAPQISGDLSKDELLNLAKVPNFENLLKRGSQIRYIIGQLY